MIAQDAFGRIERQVFGDLNGAQLTAAMPFDESSDEARFAVAWRRPVREGQPGDEHGFTYGTHVACVNATDAMLVWGHYELRSAREAIEDLKGRTRC